MIDSYYEYQKTNREKRLQPKYGLFWCWKCDRNLVEIGKRCKTCGAKPDQNRLKKETSS